MVRVRMMLMVMVSLMVRVRIKLVGVVRMVRVETYDVMFVLLNTNQMTCCENEYYDEVYQVSDLCTALTQPLIMS